MDIFEMIAFVGYSITVLTLGIQIGKCINKK